MADDPTSQQQTRQLALRLSGRPVALPPAKPPGRSRVHEVRANIAQLAEQIEALREQLRHHAADRVALLLREMIAERERELSRWLEREEGWDRRLDNIEGAIVERDAFRAREADLIRERDAAIEAAAAARAQREAAERAVEAARYEVRSVRRLVDQATAEQLRLRAERELDKQAWVSERRQLAQRLEKRDGGGWLSRLVKR